MMSISERSTRNRKMRNLVNALRVVRLGSYKEVRVQKVNGGLVVLCLVLASTLLIGVLRSSSQAEKIKTLETEMADAKKAMQSHAQYLKMIDQSYGVRAKKIEALVVYAEKKKWIE